MSRRHLALVVVAIASFVVTACGTASTAPHHDDTTSLVVTNGSGG